MIFEYGGFNWAFFSREGLSFYNRKGVYKLNKDTVVTIVLATQGTSKVYVGYEVSIINKKNGIIDNEFFHFDAYLSQENRVDEREDYKGGFHIDEDSCKKSERPDWYIAIPHPTDIVYMGNMIFCYIDSWK